MKWILTLVVICVTMAGADVFADANSPSTLDDYLTVAGRNNAELAASFEAWQVATGQIPQARALPDPKLTYELETQRTPHGQKFGIMQSLPWFGTIKSRVDAAHAAEQAARKRYDAQRVKLFSQVKQAYFEYSYLGRQIENAKQNLELLKHFEEVSRLRYATSQGNHPDHIRSEIEIATAQYELQSLEKSQAPTVAKLNAILNRTIDAPLPLPSQPIFADVNFAPEQVASAVAANNPELSAMDFEIAAARSQIELAHKKFYPEFDIGVDAMYQSEATMGPGNDPIYLKAGFSIPLWTSSYSAGERQSRASLRQVNYRKTEIANSLNAQAQRVLYELQDANRRGHLYKDMIIPRSQEMLASYEALYRSGGADFLSLIDAQRTLLKARLEYDKAVNEQSQKLAELEMLTGGTLPPVASLNR